MQKTELSWKRMRFKNNKVWLATEPDGKAVVKDGKVLIKYQLSQDYEYWVNPKAVHSLDSVPRKSAGRKKDKSSKNSSKRDDIHNKIAAVDKALQSGAICIFTDGASSGNPGPAGIGVVLHYGKHEKEISKFIGIATNNIAELKAIQAGLAALKQTDLPVRIFTDSNYAHGVLALGWKPRKNQELVESIKKIISKFKDLKFIKVKAHAGVGGNERADFLATSAIKEAGIG